MKTLTPISYKNVKILDGFWGQHQGTNAKVTIPHIYKQCEITGRINIWRLNWAEESGSEKPHIFWDSDIAKWIETASYSLVSYPNTSLEKQIDEIIDLMEKAQQPDGYLNTYFTTIEPQNRWKNLRDWHELYCAGHLIEAAVAYFDVTGKKKFLEIVCRYIDYIETVFGTEKGKKRGYPGHEEIELALVKLHKVTKEKKYLNLSKYFVDERGNQPHYFDIEAIERGESPDDYWAKTHSYTQAHIPVREQDVPLGHAVRGTYLYSAMVGLAAEFKDEKLLEASIKIWSLLTEKRMYVTGGIGSSKQNEGYTKDYDLPNETAYAETCAAIGLIFWSHRMLQITKDGKYADVIERALCNGALSGVSLKGDTFFYENPLESAGHHHRWEWHHCSCCPPNISRLISSLGQYFYSKSDDEIYIHLYGNSEAETELSGEKIKLKQTTEYPWNEETTIEIDSENEIHFSIFLRIPGWCKNPTLKVNNQNEQLKSKTKNGYLKLTRVWKNSDKIELVFPMPVENVRSHPNVKANSGRITLQRGPIIYCLEEVDNEKNLNEFILEKNTNHETIFEPDLLGGIVTISSKAKRRKTEDWNGKLYRIGEQEYETVPIKAIPYFAWDNREPGEMLVWLREEI